jgi:hypothetical protein
MRNDRLMTHQAAGKKVEVIQTRPEIEDEKLAELFGLVRRFEPSELAEFSDPAPIIQPNWITSLRGIWAWFKRPGIRFRARASTRFPDAEGGVEHLFENSWMSIPSDE